MNSHFFYILARIKLSLVEWYVGECENTLSHFKNRKRCRAKEFQISQKELDSYWFIFQRDLEIQKFDTPLYIERGLIDTLSEYFNANNINNKCFNKNIPSKISRKHISIESIKGTEGNYKDTTFESFVSESRSPTIEKIQSLNPNHIDTLELIRKINIR